MNDSTTSPTAPAVTVPATPAGPPAASGARHPLLFPRRRDGSADGVTHAVHGLVIFVAIVGATFVGDYPAWRILLFASGAVLLFAIAHVYARTLADQHTAEGTPRVAWATVRREARLAVPILGSCVAPAIPLGLAIVGVLALPLAYAISVTIAIAALAAVGFAALRGRGGSVRRAIAAGVANGAFGAAIIAAETFWH